MENFDLDLDALAPEKKTVRLNGESIQVSPPKFKNLISLLKVISKFKSIPQEDSDKQLEAIDELQRQLYPIVPRLKDEDFDIDINQIWGLINFVFSIAQPADKALLKKHGYDIADPEAEKKTETPSEQLS